MLLISQEISGKYISGVVHAKETCSLVTANLRKIFFPLLDIFDLIAQSIST